MDKPQCMVHPYSALKWKEILTPATTCMNPKDVMLSDISQPQKNKHCMMPLTRGSWSGHIDRDKVGWWAAGIGQGSGEWCSVRTELGMIKLWVKVHFECI